MNAMRCVDCVYYRDIEKWVYGAKGVEHINLKGFACTVFSEDCLKIIWMDGNPTAEITCECFEFCKKVGAEE